MPLWAQIIIGLFAIAVVYSLVGPWLTERRYRRRFRAIAQAFGQAPTKRPNDVEGFTADVGSRRFDVRREYKGGGGRIGTYRGPRGHLLITETALRGSGWSMHQIDICQADKRVWHPSAKRSLTGDTAFDSRFLVVEDGLSVRNGWLDGPTRVAVARFFEAVPLAGPIWIREGRMAYLMQSWKDVEGGAIRSLMEQQSALADALGRTAGHPD